MDGRLPDADAGAGVAVSTAAERVRNGIWEGRFQPIHRGHIAYVSLLLERCERLWIFVVENETSADAGVGVGGSPVPEFTVEVDGHHGAEKNPLPFWLRYRLVAETLAAQFPDAPITVWGGRRLDLMWDFYARALPPERVFLTPERDAFEDAKARAWARLGERVERVDVSGLPPVSATQLRERLRAGEDVGDLLHPVTERLLGEAGYLGVLSGDAR
jgi:cytidylyltransferase-like protein